MKENNTSQDIWEVIKKSKSPVCFIDSRFDFDAFGSAIALKLVIERELSKKLTLTWTQKIPEQVEKFLGKNAINEDVNPTNFDFSNVDLIICIDSGDLNHLSPTRDFTRPNGIPLINIDHHNSNSMYGDHNYVFKDYSSACLVLYKLITELNIDIGVEIANILLTGIVTDSGFFQFSAVKPYDLRAVAELMEKGADLFKICWGLNFHQSYDNMMQRKIIYNNLVVNFPEKYAYSSITLKEMRDNGIKSSKTLEAASDLIKRLDGVDYVFVIKESEENPECLKVSLRSHNPNFDVEAIAKAFGGGGHKPAAAATLPENIKTIEEAVHIVTEMVRRSNPAQG